MNIIVVLRPILDPAGFIVNRKAQKVFVNRENYILNPTDKNALEAALRLSDTVTAVSIGDAPAEDALRQARAIGASRAMLVRDAALKSADASVMTTVLQRLVHHLDGADLMLLGAEVVDADLAQLGPRLAMALGWPFVEGAQEIFVRGHGVHAITRPRASVRRPGESAGARRKRGGQKRARGPGRPMAFTKSKLTFRPSSPWRATATNRATRLAPVSSTFIRLTTSSKS